MKESMLIPPQDWYDASFDRLDQSNMIVYSVDVIGNEIRIVVNDGYLLTYGFDQNISANNVSGNWIYTDIYNANNTKVARVDDFSYYMSSIEGLDAAAVRFGAADIASYLTDQDDWYDFDPAGDNLTEFLAEQASGEASGQVTFLDGRGGVDTIVSNIWSSEDFIFQQGPGGNAQATFIPTGQVIELRNIEQIDLADTAEMSIEDALRLAQGPADDASQHSLTVIADVLGSVILLKNLNEVITENSHTIEHNGTTFNYSEVDVLITTVTRDDVFTEEFAAEIADAYPGSAGISYTTAVTLIGQPNIDATLLAVAGADGNYVG